MVFASTILIREVLGQNVAILIQNAFPTLEKYIDHIHMFNKTPARVNENLKEEILINFKQLINMNNHGTNLFFTDIDKLKQEILKEEMISN